MGCEPNFFFLEVQPWNDWFRFQIRGQEVEIIDTKCRFSKNRSKFDSGLGTRSRWFALLVSIFFICSWFCGGGGAQSFFFFLKGVVHAWFLGRWGDATVLHSGLSYRRSGRMSVRKIWRRWENFLSSIFRLGIFFLIFLGILIKKLISQHLAKRRNRFVKSFLEILPKYFWILSWKSSQNHEEKVLAWELDGTGASPKGKVQPVKFLSNI